MHKFAELVIKRRLLILIVTIFLTLFFAYQLLSLKIYTSFEDLLPQKHPYVKLHNKVKTLFGGANQILIVLQVKEGDIFNTKTLKKIKYISEELEGIPAIDIYKIRSLATRNTKELKREAGMIYIETVMFPGIPETEEELEKLKWGVYGNNMVYGSFVSYDTKKALIMADFFDDEIEYSVVFNKLRDIRREVEDENTIVSIGGTPMHYGYVWYHSKDVVKILILTVLVIIGVLYLYFRSIQGVVVPFVSGVVSGIWGLGIMSLLGYNLDPLVLVFPFLLALMTSRHAMQKLARYTEEYLRTGDGKTASQNVVAAMFMAGVTGIVTDTFGIALIAIASVPLLQNTAVTCVLWTIPTLLIALIFTPVLLSFVPVSRNLRVTFEMDKAGEKKLGPLDRTLSFLGRWIVARGKWYIVAASLVLVIFGAYYSEKITVGSVMPGSPILWPWHRYNQDALRIVRSMPMLNPLYVVVEGDKPGAMANADVIKEVYRLTRYISKEVRGVIFARSIMDTLPYYNVMGGEGDPHWAFLLDNDIQVAYSMHQLLDRAPPGTWDRFITNDISTTNIVAYCASKRGKLIKGLVSTIDQHIKNNPRLNALQGVKIRLAAGVIGIQAALNEVIASAQIWNLTFALLGLFLFCTFNFRSITAGLILTIPLAISNLIGFAIMALTEVGLTVSTYPVSSVAIGFGVDYGIYFISRLQEEKKNTEDLNTAILRTMTSNGKAIVIIATTLTLGLFCWFFSTLRFQAEMGTFFALLLLLNMLGSLLLVPSLVALIKPKFVKN
ncbi:MAG: MMPL family transporter [Deltaproteobacteria bacterium]|nr:MMPL family transporter [Deltaproteobacteria bacterium]